MKRKTEPLTGLLKYEHRTIVAMTEIYCRNHHKGEERVNKLCTDCREFVDFAEFRLVKCPYGQVKPACQNCPIHCYKKDMKEKARIIMRYSGPRMLVWHPVMAVKHLMHAKRPLPPLPKKKRVKKIEDEKSANRIEATEV
ncbi:nitrous oxide-stimulated promoter family protein [Endozoicomonas sp. OPT23]|uniref:nitrous oxide-stimulated promoter family protein n=1 Tax=Endozoicomonas sp. OPT23 TaxID=2072845 RepID=UPI00129A13AB|nr:nitrous oxide-stimulated promoter family protein [Endozoicomonas sp. OPT23]MRI33081.1 nitrous oxide-stimulated promoter family protein [Endozoicomonas sp. OPT23]